MYYIRTDANEEIGTGHVMRCLSIAEEFLKRGEQMTFLIADDHSRDIIEKCGFSAICLNTVWNNLDYETDILVQMIKDYKIKQLLIDSYFVTQKYLSALKEYTRIIYLDDLNAFVYPVDLLINYNIYATDLEYSSRYKEFHLDTRFALGCKYVPLRKQFENIKRTISKVVHKILITTGGTDNYNVTGNILKALSKQTWFVNVDFYIIIGKFNTNKEELMRCWHTVKNIHFLYEVYNMSDYMEECDVAITAGGVTTYEVCACGLPAVIYTLADNQIGIAKKMSDMNLIPYAGDVQKGMEQCVNKLVNYVTDFYNDFDLRVKHSILMQEVVDGKGCERLVDLILKMKK